MTSRLVRALLALLLVTSGSGAWAHSALTGSSPAAGTSVPAGGFPVELHFNGRVDAARSRLTLTLADGTSRKLQAKAGDGPAAIAAQVEAVPAGPCTLRYDVLSQDGHLASGTVTFTASER